MLAVEDDAGVMDHSLMEPDDLHAEHFVPEERTLQQSHKVRGRTDGKKCWSAWIKSCLQKVRGKQQTILLWCNKEWWWNKILYRAAKSNDHVLIVLMRLHLGLLNRDIAYRFGIPKSTTSKVFRTWLPVLFQNLRNLIIWPDQATLRRNLPQSFHKNCRDCVCIIDCSEISNLTAQAQTWSSYKHSNTCK